MDKLTLEKKLNDYNSPYRTTTKQIISDQEYDALIDQYELLYGSYTPQIETHYECQLPFYSPSLSKYKLKNKLLQWAEKQTSPFIVMDKLDGMSIILHYQNNNINIYTHGTGGYHGSCITHLLHYLNIPKNLKNDVVIRGELYITKETFKKYKDNYVSERNCISGVVNTTKDINYQMLSDFTFCAFEIQNSNLSLLQQLNDLKCLGFNIPHYNIVDQLDFDFLTQELNNYNNIPRDGLVIASSNIEKVDKGLPQHKIAFKILGETALTTVTEVEWNYSKHCLLKPRINYTPVFLDGGELEWCTGFHAKFIKDHNIGPGTQLLITRAGSINPYIVEVVKSTTASLPDVDYQWNNCEIYCQINDQIKIKRIYTFFDILKAKFLGLKTIEKLYHHGLTTLQDYYELTKTKLLTFNGFKEAGAKRIIEAIQKSLLKVTLAKVLAGSCLFHNFAETKLQQIINYTPTLYDIIINHAPNSLTIKELQLIPGIKKTAEDFLDMIDDFIIFLNNLPQVRQIIINHHLKNNVEINDLTNRDDDDYLPLIQEHQKDLPLQGMIILFSGDKKLAEQVKLMGAIVEKNYKKNITLLVVDQPGTMNNKESRALKDGKPIMSLKDFKIKYNL